MEKLIITCALTGAEVSKKEQPNLPVTPDEIAKAAWEVRQAGASIVHLHARNEDGTSTQDQAVYGEILRKIRESGNDIILQVSTGGAVGMSVDERIQPLSLKPEMATLTTGSVNFGEDVFLNKPKDIERIASILQQNRILPELEIFDVGMIRNAVSLIRKGLVPTNAPFDLVMGVPGGISGTPKDLLFLVDSLPSGARWAAAGIGRAQLPLAALSILMGGHVRVGFEDNIYYERGVLASSNAQLVERVVRISKELGREIAFPSEARKILGIPAYSVCI